MGKLIYSITTSLDGYVADENDSIEFTAPTEEILAVINDCLKNVGTFLFGKRMYETMSVWDTIPADSPSEGVNNFANIWNNANKIVYSTSLNEVTTADTTLEQKFDAEELRKLISSSEKDFDIGGPHLAAAAIKARLIDEYHQYIAPVILGGGNFWLPDNVSAKLSLVDVQKFGNGTVHLHFKKV